MLTETRAGYALLAVVVALVAVAVIAAVAITPNVAQVRDQFRVQHTQERLERLTDSGLAIVRFFDDVGEYPGALSHLSREITQTDQDLCGDTYSNAETGNWSGRYAGRIYSPGGTPLDVGTLQDTLEYDAGGPAMVLVVAGVREEQARRLDRRVDGSADGGAGRVWYTAADAEGRVTMRWRTTITAC